MKSFYSISDLKCHRATTRPSDLTISTNYSIYFSAREDQAKQCQDDTKAERPTFT